mgnify:CR=1 FL=1
MSCGIGDSLSYKSNNKILNLGREGHDFFRHRVGKFLANFCFCLACVIPSARFYGNDISGILNFGISHTILFELYHDIDKKTFHYHKGITPISLPFYELLRNTLLKDLLLSVCLSLL